jgi:hypothetical protein
MRRMTTTLASSSSTIRTFASAIAEIGIALSVPGLRPDHRPSAVGTEP